MVSPHDPNPNDFDATLAHGGLPRPRPQGAPEDFERTLVQPGTGPAPAAGQPGHPHGHLGNGLHGNGHGNGAASLMGTPDLTRVPGNAGVHGAAPDLTQVPGGAPVPDLTQVPGSATHPPTGGGPDMTLVGGEGHVASGQAGLPGERVQSTRFEILAVLGQGGMGKVFRARDVQIEGRQVALKVLHPHFSRDARFRELFFQEIRAAQGFVSKHAVQIRDTGQMPDGALFLTMDLVSGESLSRMLRREGALAPHHAFEIARQILLGLQSGHDHGLVHRDIKPSNVMLAARVPKTPENPNGVGVRLLDFGIAGLVKDQQEGSRTGTPRYMSPEQVQGQRLDARSDLFAVGVVLFEMLTGARPFDGETLENVETAILETQIEPLVRDLDGLPSKVKKILVKALRKDREKRYQSAAEFLKAIERAKVTAPDGRMGLGSKVALALLATLAGAEATVLLHQRGELQGLRAENGEELASLQTRLDERDTELSRLQARLTQEGDLDTRFFDLQRDYDKLSEENSTLQRRNEDLERRTAELGNARLEEKPAAKTAACFDEVLKRVDHDAGRSAVELLEDRAGAGVFALDGLDGRALVRALASCALALESARKESGVDTAQLARAETLLERVRTERADFETEAAGWLTFAPAGAERVDRVARLDATIAHLEGALVGLHEQAASSQEVAWERVAAGPDDQDPEAAMVHAGLYGAASIVELVDRYAAHLENTVVRDGRLDAQALANALPLVKWGTWLAGDGAALDGTGAETLRAFTCARDWYVEHADEPAFAHLFERLPQLEDDEPHADWRAQLALQLALARSDAYPLSPERTAVMRHTWTQSGAGLWFLERLEARDAEGWRVERRIHDLGGASTGRPQVYTVTFLDDAYFVEGTKALDLRSASASYGVATFHAQGTDPLPERPWVRDLDVTGYTDEVSSASVPCLVVTAGSTRFWFSPRFGLVRETRDDVYEREQVFYSAFR